MLGLIELFVVLTFGIGWAVIELVGLRLDRQRKERAAAGVPTPPAPPAEPGLSDRSGASGTVGAPSPRAPGTGRARGSHGSP